MAKSASSKALDSAASDSENDRTQLLEKTHSLASTRAPSNYEEGCAIWNMGWKVSLATFCRISLSTISAAFLGHLGSNELAASALASIWTNGVQILIFGFAVSLCTMCGQAYGAKNYELVGIWLQLGLIFLTLFSIPVMISFFYVDHLLSFVTDDLEVLHLADTYARYLVPTVLPQAVYCALRQYLQAQEIVTPATIISILSVGVCLASNYVFIYGFGPIPALHFIGSPIAQCVASWFQPTALWVYAFWYKGYHKKTWYGFKISECLQWSRVKYFISLSLGMTLNLALDEWVYNVVSSLAGSLGAKDLAANSVMFNLWGLIFGVYWGFGLPTQVRAANFLGANEPALAQQTLRVGFVLGGIAAALSALCVYLFRASIISVFTPDLEVAATINQTLPVFCLAVFVSGLHIIMAAVVEAMSLASTLVRITCTGSWLVMLPISYLLGIVWHHGLRGLWWGSVCGETTKFVLMASALLRIDWYEMARRAVERSEGGAAVLLDESELEEDVEMRVSFMGATTPTMSGMSPVVTIFSTPQQVHHHHHRDRGTSELLSAEEGSSGRGATNFQSSSYGATA
uniref:Multidrug and toxin extrusion protein n=1 Tax=Globisporangium ultimum (strain ATCC 200006 / CBS 805.95 / DAOM BR144) TaxID=431595 RepID=K3WFX8_GLOUD